MSTQLVERELFLSTNSLCEACGNAVPQLCSFIRAKDSEAALAFVGAEAVRIKVKPSRGKEVEIYKVTLCRKYRPGNLPDMAEITHKAKSPDPTSQVGEIKKYDLSCPICNGLGYVAVAGIRENPKNPQEWYCRCKSCNKSFRPRKKEVVKSMNAVNDSSGLLSAPGHSPENREIPDKLTREWLTEEIKTRTVEDIQVDFPSNINVKLFASKWGLLTKVSAEELLPREKLVEYKAQGMTDREIYKATGIIPKDFYRLKEQYGLKERGVTRNTPKGDSPNQELPEDKQEGMMTASHLTITQMLQLQQEMAEDLTELTCILDNIGSDSHRVEKLLKYYRDEYQRCLDRIGEVFSSTKVAL